MAKSRTDILADAILKELHSREGVDEEWFRRLFAHIAQADIDEFAHSASFTKLSHEVKAHYAYGDGDGSFDQGAAWASVSIIEATRGLRDSMERSLSIRSLVERESEIVDAIFDRPGITHGELSAETGIKVSNLTHKMTRLKNEGIAISRASGKYRMYYLTDAAEAIERERRSDQRDGLEVRYQISVRRRRGKVEPGGEPRNDVRLRETFYERGTLSLPDNNMSEAEFNGADLFAALFGKPSKKELVNY